MKLHSWLRAPPWLHYRRVRPKNWERTIVTLRNNSTLLYRISGVTPEATVARTLWRKNIWVKNHDPRNEAEIEVIPMTSEKDVLESKLYNAS